MVQTDTNKKIMPITNDMQLDQKRNQVMRPYKSELRRKNG